MAPSIAISMVDSYDDRPSSPLTPPSSPTSSVSTATTETRPSAPRVYLYARRKGVEPDTGIPVAFEDLEYWLRVEHLPEVVDIPLHLFGISQRSASKYRWMVVFTRSPMFDTMELPDRMAKVLRELLMFFYRTSQEEKGFTLELYKDVGAAIVHHTDYGVPPEPVDQTPWLLALLKHINQEVGPNALKDRQYTPGEIHVAEELAFGYRSYDKNTWIWPWPSY